MKAHRKPKEKQLERKGEKTLTVILRLKIMWWVTVVTLQLNKNIVLSSGLAKIRQFSSIGQLSLKLLRHSVQIKMSSTDLFVLL